jgi:hypothetical protein
MLGLCILVVSANLLSLHFTVQDVLLSLSAGWSSYSKHTS